MMAMPLSWRCCLCVAHDDIFGNPIWRVVALPLGNGFPFFERRVKSVGNNVEHLCRLWEQNWSVLIYSQGHITYSKKDSFKPGAGMIPVESPSQIVPLRVPLNKTVFYNGDALILTENIDYRQLTGHIKAVVQVL